MADQDWTEEDDAPRARMLIERPLPVLGIALGAGILFGILTTRKGGGRPRRSEAGTGAEARARKWERRARHLLKVARQREEELEALARGHRPRRRKARPAARKAQAEGLLGGLGDLRGVVAEHLSGYVVSTIRQILAQGSKKT